MKRICCAFLLIGLLLPAFGQAPQKLSYQAVVRNPAGKLIQNGSVGVRFSIRQGTPDGTIVYTETQNGTTNVNGLLTMEIGTGTTLGNFGTINWANGPYFLMTEIDPSGGILYSVIATAELLSVPYALHSMNAATVGANGFSGDYNDLTNKPVIDGSETKITAGSNIKVSGLGTQADPYLIRSPNNGGVGTKVILTNSQTWTVPSATSRIKVELWGGAGGGGGAGAYSYSYNFNNGGSGGTGGYAMVDINVVPNQQFQVTVGSGGVSGTNAWPYPPYYGDTDGTAGGDTWFNQFKAAGGQGGKRGSYTSFTVNGLAGWDNIGLVTAKADPPQNGILNVYYGSPRSYINERVLGSKPGKGGTVMGYSMTTPENGEAGAVVITLFE